MKINLDFKLKNLKNTIVDTEDGHAGILVASLLANSNKGNSIKLFSWAMKFYDKKEVELDLTDKDVLYAFIETSEQISNLAKAQVLISIKEQWEKGEKKEEKK